MTATLDIRETLARTRADQDKDLVQLVLEAQAGDREALETLFERFEGFVDAAASRLVDSWDEVAEIRQEVFIVVMRKLHQLQVPQAFPSWLRQTTHRTAINYRRRQRRMFATDPDDMEAVCGVDETAGRQAMLAETRSAVAAGMQRLGEMDRATLEAFYFRDRTILQMCDDFDAPEGTIKRRLHTARKRLAEQLELV